MKIGNLSKNLNETYVRCQQYSFSSKEYVLHYFIAVFLLYAVNIYADFVLNSKRKFYYFYNIGFPFICVKILND